MAHRHQHLVVVVFFFERAVLSLTSLQDDLRVVDKGLGSGGSWRGTRLRLPLVVSTARTTREIAWTLALCCLYSGIQVDGESTISGVNGAYYTGDFIYTNLDSTSYLPSWPLSWQSSRRRVDHKWCQKRVLHGRFHLRKLGEHQLLAVVASILAIKSMVS